MHSFYVQEQLEYFDAAMVRLKLPSPQSSIRHISLLNPNMPVHFNLQTSILHLLACTLVNNDHLLFGIIAPSIFISIK